MSPHLALLTSIAAAAAAREQASTDALQAIVDSRARVAAAEASLHAYNLKCEQDFETAMAAHEAVAMEAEDAAATAVEQAAAAAAAATPKKKRRLTRKQEPPSAYR
jgi:hypothetical protein